MNALVGTGLLFAAALKRDFIRIITWALTLPVIHLGAVIALRGVFDDDPVSMAARGAIIETPTGIIFGGPGYGSDHYTVAAMIANELTFYYEIPLAIGLLLLVIRATRGDEESGRFELVGAAGVGRLSALASSLLTALLIAVSNGVLLTAAGVATGLELHSSLLWAWGIAGCGFLFASLGAVCAQLSTSERNANLIALVALGTAFALRAVGDIQRLHGSLLSWFSPLAWTHQLRAYVAPRAWPLLLYLVVSVALTALAFVLAARRDFGAGLLPNRLGRATAPRTLNSPLALPVRLLRTTVLAWLVAVVAFGAACGPLLGQLGAYVRDNAEVYEKLLGVSADAANQVLVDAFIAYLLLFFAVFGAVAGVMALGRLRDFETQGIMELQLAHPVSRIRLLGAWCTVALVSPVLLLTAGAFSTGILTPAEYWGDSPTALAFSINLAKQSLVYLPAAAVMIGVAALLIGWAPKFINLAWAYLSYVVFCGMFGTLLGLPEWAIKISAIGATPALPGHPMQWPPVLVLCAIAIALVGAGLIGFRNRDIPQT